MGKGEDMPRRRELEREYEESRRVFGSDLVEAPELQAINKGGESDEEDGYNPDGIDYSNIKLD